MAGSHPKNLRVREGVKRKTLSVMKRGGHFLYQGLSTQIPPTPLPAFISPSQLLTIFTTQQNLGI